MKNHVGIVSMVVVLLSVGVVVGGNDVLYLQDGRERVGELVAIDSDGVVFRVQDEAEPTVFAAGDVQRVDLSRKRAGDEIRRVEDLDDPLLKRVLDRKAKQGLLGGLFNKLKGEEDPDKAEHPDSGHIVLYVGSEYTVHEDGSFTCRERVINKVLLERGKALANVARGFLKGEQTLEIDFARTINPDGRVTPISDAAVDVTSYHSDLPDYEKLYHTKFAMKQVRALSVLDWQVTAHHRETNLLYPFFYSTVFQGSEPIVEQELRINVSSAMRLVWHADRLTDNIEFTMEETDGGTVYRWVGRDCPRVVPEPMMPPYNDLLPRVTAALETTWPAIGQAYAEAMAEVDDPTEAIQAKVRELVAGVEAPDEKARRIYNYFIQNVRQLWVRPAEYSYRPRSVGKVFEKLAGNTIDKGMLLVVMLREAGLDAHFVLCRTQGAGRVVEAVPCIRQFNDVLVAVDLPRGRRYLGFDDETVRFGEISVEYQGTRGLLVRPGGSELVTIPLNPPEREADRYEYEMRVTPAGDLHVDLTARYAGSSESALRSAWKDMKDEEVRRSLMVDLSSIHSKARLGDYAFENLDDLNEPAFFTQSYVLHDYAMRAGDDLLVFRLPEIEYSAMEVGKPDREFPLYWSSRSMLTNDIRLEIPPDFKVYYAGKDYEADGGVATFTADFDVEDRVIRYRDAYVHTETRAGREAYAAYKACLETQAQVSKEWVVLERVQD